MATFAFLMDKQYKTLHKKQWQLRNSPNELNCSCFRDIIDIIIDNNEMRCFNERFKS